MQDYSKLAPESDILREEIKVFEYRVSWSCSATKNINICPFLNLITVLNLEVKKLFGKLSSGHRTGKCQFSFQSQRKPMLEYSNYHTTVLISHASKVMLKILQARFQQHVNCELPDVQVGFRKGRGTRDQIGNICWIIEKAREFQKNIYFWFIDYAKALDCVDHHKL